MEGISHCWNLNQEAGRTWKKKNPNFLSLCLQIFSSSLPLVNQKNQKNKGALVTGSVESAPWRAHQAEKGTEGANNQGRFGCDSVKHNQPGLKQRSGWRT